MKEKIVKYIIISIYLLFAFSQAYAQTVRDITVAYDKSFTDHISLANDSRDMDLMVKFIFNEEANQLTISLISYRYLFVFREDARYGNIIHHNRLDPEDLPYVTDFPEKSRFILSKNFKKSIPKPQKNYIFTKWIEYKGLQPIPMNYKMVNDYIEQSFDVTNYGKNVIVKLGDVYVMDKTPSKKHPFDYTFVAGKNLNTEYKITIVRNPCFGLENEIELADNTLEAVTKAYQSFSDKYKSGEVNSEEELNTFQDLKLVLQTQFKLKNCDSQCPDLKNTWDQYDCYVDSISAIECTLKTKEETGLQVGNVNFDPTEVTTLSRQIDRNISRWLLSKDIVEKQDLVKECEDIISEVNSIIGKSQGTTPEQKKALNLFRQAEVYFRNTCGKKRQK